MSNELENGPPTTYAGISWTKSTGESDKGKRDRARFIVSRIRILLASYRRDNTPNPEGYIGAIGLVLERFADQVILDATDPVTGVVAQERWRAYPPTAGELRGWCENHSIVRKSAYERRVERQLREREELERLHDSISPEERAAHVVRVENELAEHGLFTAGWKRRQRETEIARTRAAVAAHAAIVQGSAPGRVPQEELTHGLPTSRK
jgi:hypothetical protein